MGHDIAHLNKEKLGFVVLAMTATNVQN